MGSRACRSIVSSGAEGILVDIECHISNNLPIIIIVGFASKAVNEARDRLRGAFASSGLKLPRRRITINLAPADLQKTDSGLDLAMAVAILAVTQEITRLTDTEAVIGELGLDGRTRPVRGIIGKLLAGRQQGLHTFYIPAANLTQAQLIPGITLFPVANLLQLDRHLRGIQRITPVVSSSAPLSKNRLGHIDTSLLEEVAGQSFAKRALSIAAAGGHSIFLMGPPGTGKSLLARALSSLLPPPDIEEVLEITHLSSLASHNYDRLVTKRPVRSPHHTATPTAMIGSGSLPGEISLSHRGVLLLDEFPEFSRHTLEALRQPLEEHVVNVARQSRSAHYPAHFLLAATANPCPCGYAGSTDTPCSCSTVQLQRYHTKLSGPLFDRIDLCCTLEKVEHKKLTGHVQPSVTPPYALQITQARRIQGERYESTTLLNSDLDGPALRQTALLDAAAAKLLNEAADRLHLSARGYLKVLKVARTIADMEAAKNIDASHISEALQYRKMPIKTLV